MTIALDYDDTFTADPELWRDLIRTARNSGHKVICVTCRQDTIEVRKQIDDAFAPVALPLFCTNGSPKRWFMERCGWIIDVWIDDMPEGILHGR